MQSGLQGLDPAQPSKSRAKCVHTQPCADLRKGGLTLPRLTSTPFAVPGISASSALFKAGFTRTFSSTIDSDPGAYICIWISWLHYAEMITPFSGWDDGLACKAFPIQRTHVKRSGTAEHRRVTPVLPDRRLPGRGGAGSRPMRGLVTNNRWKVPEDQHTSKEVLGSPNVHCACMC